MKWQYYSLRIIGIFIIIIFLGCGTVGRQFQDGLAVLTGRGGRVAHEDLFDETVKQADILSKHHLKAQWASTFNGEGADIIHFLDENRILVGTVESGAMLGVPEHTNIMLMDAKTGSVFWETGRKGLTNGHYLLLLTEPLIILSARDDTKTSLLAYNPANGDNVWNYTVDSPDQFLISEEMDRMILLSAQEEGRKVEALDILTGNLIWSRELPAAAFSSGLPDYFDYGDNAVYVSGRTLFKISETDGTILWSKSHPVLKTKERFVSPTSEGILIYNANSISLINKSDGTVKWGTSSQKSFNVNCTVLDKNIYRVSGKKNSSGVVINGQKIHALSPKNGKVLWSRSITGEVVSPLCLEQNVVTFTTNEGIYGLNSKNGKTHFHKTFSAAFTKGAPDKATNLKRPDLIRFRSGKIFVAREMAGISAYAFPSGNPLWEQLLFDLNFNAYSADGVYTFIEKTYLTKQAEATDVPLSADTSARPNPFIQSAQRQYEDMRTRTGRVLEDDNSTRAERKAAHQERAMGASLVASQMAVSQAGDRMMAAGDLAVSIMNLGTAIQSAYAEIAQQGVIAREILFLDSVMALPLGAFQENYYIWPFKHRAERGVTLVDLRNGNRCDLIYSPWVHTLDAYGAILPLFTLGPDGKTLVMVGLGLDSNKYEKHTKWNTSLPKSSILSYNVNEFYFGKISKLQKLQAQEVRDAAVKLKKTLEKTKDIQEIDKIHTAAQMGNLDLVRSMLDSGVDVDVRNHDQSGTPLVFAVIGSQVEMVRFLISRGADVNFKSGNSASVLGHAKIFNNQEIIEMLKNAGAK